MLEINTNKYKMDQMAIKLFSDGNNTIEITETSDCEYCQYQIVKSNEHNIEINKNNFIIFLNNKITSISLTFNGLENVEVAYGIVELVINNTKYLPLAYQFEGINEEKIKKNIKLNNTFYKKYNNSNQYQAFIFSVKNNETINKYFLELEIIELEIIENNTDNNGSTDLNIKTDNTTIFNIILIISLFLSLSVCILFFIIFKMNRTKKIYYNNIDKLLDE